MVSKNAIRLINGIKQAKIFSLFKTDTHLEHSVISPPSKYSKP